MPVEIILPVGTERIKVSDIPELFATAIHPKLAENTPRQIVEVKKMPLSEANKSQWCGKGMKAFPVTLTDEDKQNIWAMLPPLILPIDEAEWEPYVASFAKANITDWELRITHRQDPSMTQGMLWHATVDEYEIEVRNAVKRGELEPRSPLTLLPIPQAMGQQLLDSFVTVENLKEYAARIHIGVKEAAPAAKVETPKLRESATRETGANPTQKLAQTWWRTDYDIKLMAQNAGDSLRRKGENTSNRSIGDAVALEIETRERTGKKRKGPDGQTIKNTDLKGWKYLAE